MGKGARGCFRGGCIGCLGVFVLLVVGVLLVALLGRTAPEPRQETAERSWQPPGTPTGGAGGEVEAIPVLPGVQGSPESVELTGLEPLELVLDLAMGDFTIVPGEPGQPITIEADYDAAAFELEESFDEARNRYEIRFGSRLSWLSLMGGSREVRNRVRITLPPGVPLTIAGRIRMGQSRVDLGGLSVAGADFDLSMGDHTVDFSAPLPLPMESFRVEGRMGEVDLERLGNASPRQLSAHHRMGEMEVDLTGAWQEDAYADIECAFGECRVRRPGPEAVLELGKVSVSFGERRTAPAEVEETAPGTPVVHLEMSGRFGEVGVR